MAADVHFAAGCRYEKIDGELEGWVVGGEVAKEEYGGRKGVGDKYWAVGNEGCGLDW